MRTLHIIIIITIIIIIIVIIIIRSILDTTGISATMQWFLCFICFDQTEEEADDIPLQISGHLWF